MKNDPVYLNAARLIVERVLERQEPKGGWERVLKEGHCGAPAPRARGEAGFMVGVLLSGLRRFHEITGDDRVAEAIHGGVHWLIEKTFEPDKKDFRYTNCPNRGGGAGPGFSKSVVEGLIYSNHLKPDPFIAEIISQGMKNYGKPHLATITPDHAAENLGGYSGYGKDLCMETRCVPVLLAYLPNARTGSSPT